MRSSSSGNNTSVVLSGAVRWAAPLVMCGMLLTGCSGGGEPANPPGQAGQEADGATEGDAPGGDAPEDGTPDGSGDGEVKFGDVTVNTQIPEEFPPDLPLPAKGPTSVVTVGAGGGEVGGGWSLNYDGVGLGEVEQLMKDAAAAGYDVGGPFGDDSQQWSAKKDKTLALVVFDEQAGLSITVTGMP